MPKVGFWREVQFVILQLNKNWEKYLSVWKNENNKFFTYIFQDIGT